jgi:hypothetical protein
MTITLLFMAFLVIWGRSHTLLVDVESHKFAIFVYSLSVFFDWGYQVSNYYFQLYKRENDLYNLQFWHMLYCSLLGFEVSTMMYTVGFFGDFNLKDFEECKPKKDKEVQAEPLTLRNQNFNSNAKLLNASSGIINENLSNGHVHNFPPANLIINEPPSDGHVVNVRPTNGIIIDKLSDGHDSNAASIENSQTEISVGSKVFNTSGSKIKLVDAPKSPKMLLRIKQLNNSGSRNTLPDVPQSASMLRLNPLHNSGSRITPVVGQQSSLQSLLRLKQSQNSGSINLVDDPKSPPQSLLRLNQLEPQRRLIKHEYIKSDECILRNYYDDINIENPNDYKSNRASLKKSSLTKSSPDIMIGPTVQKIKKEIPLPTKQDLDGSLKRNKTMVESHKESLIVPVSLGAMEVEVHISVINRNVTHVHQKKKVDLPTNESECKILDHYMAIKISVPETSKATDSSVSESINIDTTVDSNHLVQSHAKEPSLGAGKKKAKMPITVDLSTEKRAKYMDNQQGSKQPTVLHDKEKEEKSSEIIDMVGIHIAPGRARTKNASKIINIQNVDKNDVGYIPMPICKRGEKNHDANGAHAKHAGNVGVMDNDGIPVILIKDKTKSEFIVQKIKSADIMDMDNRLVAPVEARTNSDAKDSKLLSTGKFSREGIPEPILKDKKKSDSILNGISNDNNMVGDSAANTPATIVPVPPHRTFADGHLDSGLSYYFGDPHATILGVQPNDLDLLKDQHKDEKGVKRRLPFIERAGWEKLSEELLFANKGKGSTELAKKGKGGTEY